MADQSLKARFAGSLPADGEEGAREPHILLVLYRVRARSLFYPSQWVWSPFIKISTLAGDVMLTYWIRTVRYPISYPRT